ncbi:MAG: siderophore-interacting protein [Stenotrophomonas nitritireducens]|uniref:Siderophore-interacting protein n=1 Tax=Stenotrophomonas nitritireducens TaxID=83617 RepID=A0A9D8KZZ0_9GAMM|nr:siderophore-interacting protein [Stenotrophomonas nitritireducens]MBN8791457.1 siderophore-interacting protein [Stenotrophomonas nitritireducens]MBN8795396.1 siderophore-interacting protein [Stenotrophomonas nitritireducens]MBN8799027.1 siderophore-interacting protein [Stenotrophomonas nitritireducens]
MSLHENRTLRLTPRFRQLQVLHRERLTPNMQRIVVGGDELAGFESPAPDDHVKLFFPNAEGVFVLPELTASGPCYPEGQAPSPARDYTPRHHDADAGELVLDFVLHGHGVASTWAANAQVGDALVVAGPRGSHLVADDYDAYVLIGDETALPAIARRLAELPEHAQAEVLIEIPEEGDRQPLPSAAQVRVSWLERNGFDAASSTLLEDALVDFEAPDGDAYYWIALESRRARMMRKFVEGHLQVPKDWIRATGYWKAHPDEAE